MSAVIVAEIPSHKRGRSGAYFSAVIMADLTGTCPAVPREIHDSDSEAYFIGVAPEDLSAFGGWYWGAKSVT